MKGTAALVLVLVLTFVFTAAINMATNKFYFKKEVGTWPEIAQSTGLEVAVVGAAYVAAQFVVKMF